MTDESNILLQQLRNRWRKSQKQALIRGFCELVAVAVLLIFVALALDWSINLAPDARIGLMLAILVVIAVVVYLRLLRRLRPFNPLHEALREEAENPGLESLFVSYLQLDKDEAGDRVSAGMIDMVKRQALDRAREHVFARTIRFEQLRKILAVGGGAVVALLIAVVILPGVFGTLAHRMLVPYSMARYPSDTRLATVSGDLTVRQYDSVTTVVEAGGVVPDRGEVLARPDGGRWERIRIERAEGDRFRHEFVSVTDSFDYRFDVGDARSRVHRVNVVPPPQIVDASVTLNYPGYTKLAAETMSKLNVEAPEGTTVSWELTLDRPIERAALVRPDGEPIPAELSADGRTIRAELKAEASLSYRYRFDWMLEGRPQQNETARHFIQVIPDVAPRVAISYPRSSGKATLAKRLTIEFTAADDYAISEAKLIYALNDGAEQTRELDIATEAAGVESLDAAEDQQVDPRRVVELDPTQLVPDLREGDMLSYRIEVADNRSVASGPQQARSRVLRLQFVSEQEYMADLVERRSRLLSQLEPVYKQERAAQSNLINLADALRPKEDDQP